MFRLFPRYDINGLHSYFQPDFDVVEQDPTGQEGMLFRPVMAHLRCRDVGKIQWKPVTRGEFKDISQRVLARYPVQKSGKGKIKKGHPCALELIAAPSKSCSVLAVAGPVVDESLVRIHRRSIDLVLEWMREFFVTRRKNDQDFGVDLLRFPQFLNADQHPHLHDHLIFLWNAGEEKRGALHAYPIFFHLSAFQSLYHFALVALAKRFGFPIKLDGLKWNVGLQKADLRAFSPRGETIKEIAREWVDFESVGAAEHFASLGLRKEKPALQRISLVEARKRWKKIIPAERCVVQKVRHPSDAFPERIELTPFFSASAVTTSKNLAGRILSDWRGRVYWVKGTLKRIRSAIDAGVSIGKLFVGKRNSVCHPELFRVEQEILDAIRSGLGKGNACKIVMPEEPLCSRRLASAARRPDRVRIISQAGRHLKEGARLQFLGSQSSAEPPILFRLEAWNAIQVLGVLRKNPHRDVLVLVQESAHAGDFVSLASRIVTLPAEDSLVRSSQLLLDRKALEVVEGELPRAAKGRFRLLEQRSREELRVVVVAEDYPEDVRLAWNDLLARRLFGLLVGAKDDGSVLYNLDDVIPWSRVGENFDWSSHSLFCLRNNALFRHGARWSIAGFSNDRLQLQGKRRGKSVSIEQLLEVKDTIALVRPRITRLVAGTQLECLLDFRKDRRHLRAGEVVLLSQVLADKSLVLDDGRVVPSVYRAFRPAFLMGQVIRSSRVPDVVVVADPPDTKILAYLRQYEFWKKMILLAKDRKKLRELIAAEIAAELKKKKESEIVRLLDEVGDGEAVSHGVIPPRSSWPSLDLRTEVELEIPAEVESSSDDEEIDRPEVLGAAQRDKVEVRQPVSEPSVTLASGLEGRLSADVSFKAENEAEAAVPQQVAEVSEEDKPTPEAAPKEMVKIEEDSDNLDALASGGSPNASLPGEPHEVVRSTPESLADKPTPSKKSGDSEESEVEKKVNPAVTDADLARQPRETRAKKKAIAKGKNQPYEHNIS